MRPARVECRVLTCVLPAGSRCNDLAIQQQLLVVDDRTATLDGPLQITLSANNMWGIIHMIVELLMKHEDGKYVVMKVSQGFMVTRHAQPY